MKFFHSMSLNAFVLDVPTIDFHRLKAKFRFNRTFHLHTTPRTDALNGSSDSGYWKSSHTHRRHATEMHLIGQQELFQELEPLTGESCN